jgi:hypothetical protein
VACARCHDHKFDPISTKDYYALAGIFFSTHILPNVGPKTGGPPMLRIPLESAAEKDQRAKRVAKAQELERELKRLTEQRYGEFARQMLPQTADYILAAADFRQQQAKNVDAFAAERKLHPFALRRWAESLAGGEDRLMLTKVRDVLGNAGIHGWRGTPDCPSLLVNTTQRETKILTFKLPPKSVAVHPGPKSGVVLAWKSPVAGKVRVRGELIDADPQCGDGIAWALDMRQSAGRRELATGEFANGSRQKLSDGKNGANLAAIEVAAGDVLELVVLPKLDYTCDTTLVDLTISTLDGSKSWTATIDLLDDIHSGNPHKDGYGNPGVWSFADMGERQRGVQPLPELNAWRRLPANASSSQRRQAAEVIQKEFSRVDSTSPFWIGAVEQESALPAEARSQLAALRKELDVAKKAAAAPAKFANGAQEGGVPGSPHAGVHDVHVHIRGRYDRLGELVPRRFVEILAGLQQTPTLQGSGRRELADWLTLPDHPLTARVMVNRLWQYHFGEGLVRTPSNFGKLGERPTHPELLDWLATEFVREGWSIKQMHRLIMLSATYRQSSNVELGMRNAESKTVPQSAIRNPQLIDPDNRLFGWMNRRRLEAEALRDNLLAVSGRLDRTTGGPATRDFNNPRRSLYQMTVRSDRSGFGPLFDVADPTALIDRRTVSTVAPQALFLLNNPFVIDDVRALSERLQKSAPKNEERIRRAYELLYARPPTIDEERVGLSFLRSQPAATAWLAYCQVLLCANEFVYVD